MNATIADLAEAIHNATGYTGAHLTQATLVASALLADAVGRKDIGDHFFERAKSLEGRVQAEGR